MFRRFSLLVLACCATLGLSAQSGFYSQDTVQEIRIYFAESNWDYILDSLFVEGQEKRLKGDVVINGDTLSGVGIRYKGFSSVSITRVKNPFNIDIDYSDGGLEYDGIDKIKLSNVIQDPSFIRETLSYEIARKYMPASYANYANVYVNDTLMGLYTNVESVEGKWLNKRFGHNDNTFFKCNPASLDLTGENSNLSNTHGTNAGDYYDYYELKSLISGGWWDLYDLIHALNEDSSKISEVLNVDQTLWMHAFNYALINFDSYVGYSQNYYLYLDNYGRFNPIIWDLNMSFGSFRFSDGSTFWNGFNIAEAKVMDPLQHHVGVSVNPRPLMRELFANERWRKMYMAHLRTIIDENFSNGLYYARGQQLQMLVDFDVAADSNKFYTYADFLTNIDTTVSDLIEYTGIRDLMEDRMDYLNNYEGFRANPTFDTLIVDSTGLSVGDDIWLRTEVTNADSVFLMYRWWDQAPFTSIPMYDDGQHWDFLPGDGIFGVQIPDIASQTQFYLYAENDSAGEFLPARAAYEFYSVSAEIEVGQLVINEFMAANNIGILDPAGETEDWIELHNYTVNEISTAGFYLSDDASNFKKWPIDDVVIPGSGYLIIWADEDGKQDGVHCNFQLNEQGEEIILSNGSSIIYDRVSFGPQSGAVSMARWPNGSGDFMEQVPTPDSINLATNDGVVSQAVWAWPNPADDLIYVKSNIGAPLSIQMFDSFGRKVMEFDSLDDRADYDINTSSLNNGIYTIRTNYRDTHQTVKVVIQH